MGLPLTNAVSTTTESALPVIVAANESLLYSIHNAGLPWWATIVSSTFLLRSCLTLPIAIYQQRSLGKMINLGPMIQSWAETLKVQIAKESNKKGGSYQQYQGELQQQYRKKVKQIYAHHGCSRWKILLLPWIQMPLFITMSLALRDISAMPLPWFGMTSEIPALGLSEEGVGWFTDLTAVDSTTIAPFLIGFGNLANVECDSKYCSQDTLCQSCLKITSVKTARKT
ncbi:60Kd inner membrane protein-domain-containing protein [Mycotypha africana]|uniref:60Kd inner membrane protein-domain-containing protein n=1 Tax=Mycotypha africana TaxID=64632 RepID=UPI002301BD3F|nr:60Kd inner membrane protein-domain-containing protein [Mycotypha africana]KAI8967441.1 60Kd inner membrane protein-domain-containing protein [Mycotypha africana]